MNMNIIKRLRFTPLVMLLALAANSQQTEIKTVCASNNEIRIEPSVKHQDLSVLLDTIGSVKLASRKTRFSEGEVMLLDVALLNKSNLDYIFPSVVSISLHAQDQKGNEIIVNNYSLTETTTTYKVLKSKRIETKTFELHIGCPKSLFSTRDLLWNAKNDAEIFEKNLFISMGDACIGVNRPGIISIFANLENRSVLVSDQHTGMKTGIGVLRSSKLQLTIIK